MVGGTLPSSPPPARRELPLALQGCPSADTPHQPLEDSLFLLRPTPALRDLRPRLASPRLGVRRRVRDAATLECGGFGRGCGAVGVACGRYEWYPPAPPTLPQSEPHTVLTHGVPAQLRTPRHSPCLGDPSSSGSVEPVAAPGSGGVGGRGGLSIFLHLSIPYDLGHIFKN